MKTKILLLGAFALVLAACTTASPEAAPIAEAAAPIVVAAPETPPVTDAPTTTAAPVTTTAAAVTTTSTTEAPATQAPAPPPSTEEPGQQPEEPITLAAPGGGYTAVLTSASQGATNYPITGNQVDLPNGFSGDVTIGVTISYTSSVPGNNYCDHNFLTVVCQWDDHATALPVPIVPDTGVGTGFTHQTEASVEATFDVTVIADDQSHFVTYGFNQQPWFFLELDKDQVTYQILLHILSQTTP